MRTVGSPAVLLLMANRLAERWITEVLSDNHTFASRLTTGAFLALNFPSGLGPLESGYANMW